MASSFCSSSTSNSPFITRSKLLPFSNQLTFGLNNISLNLIFFNFVIAIGINSFISELSDASSTNLLHSKEDKRGIFLNSFCHSSKKNVFIGFIKGSSFFSFFSHKEIIFFSFFLS